MPDLSEPGVWPAIDIHVADVIEVPRFSLDARVTARHADAGLVELNWAGTSPPAAMPSVSARRPAVPTHPIRLPKPAGRAARAPPGPPRLLRRIADAVEAGQVPEPHVGIQFVLTAEQDQGAALTTAASLFPGTEWAAFITHHRSMGPSAHIKGSDGRVRVTISGAADQLPAAVVYGLTGEHQQTESGAAA